MKNDSIQTTPEALNSLRTSIRRSTKAILKPAPRLKLSEWCDEYRHLSSESSPEPGRWRTDRAPYQREMLDCAGDYRTSKMVVMSSAQIGKTSLLENICAFYISSDPSPILMVMPELVTAKAFSTDRLDPMFRDTPVLRGIVKEKRSRDSGNTQLQKRFPGGHLTIIGANSASGLRSRPIRVLLMDEVDAYPVSAGKEGDPVNLATARTSNFWNRKVILTSTPTVKDLSRIEREFNQSDQRYFKVPCPHCHEVDKLKWKNVHWDDNNPDTAHMVCEKCGCIIEESDKLGMMLKGEWVKENPGSDIAGFHLNALYSPWRTWKEIARQFLEAKGNPETLKTFINTVLGEAWEDQGDRVDFHTLAQRLEEYPAEVPDGVGILTAGVDVQSDRIEVAVWGWGDREEAWLIATDAIYKDPGTEAAWNDLTLTLARRYTTKNGRDVGVRAVAVDTGYMSEHVYRYVKGFRGRFQMIPVKGGSEPNRPLLSRPRVSKKGQINLFTVGTDTAKDMIFARLKIAEPGAGYLHFPNTIDREVLEQITSEKAVTTYSKGVPKREWRKTRPRNEQLDMLVYSMAALQSLGTNIIPQLGVIAKQLSESTDATTADTLTVSKPDPQTNTMVQRRIVGRFKPPLGSWNRGWNV